MSRRRLPVLTLILIAANISAAFVLLWQPELVTQFGFSANHPSVFTALTSLFLHQNVLHLMGNMIFLAAVGASVELATGSIRFLIVYFVSGLMGVLLHWMVWRSIPDSSPLIGASGCIAGCAGYYAFRYTKLKVPLGPKVGASILAISVGWLAVQALGAFVRVGDPTSTISYWAHIGGFCAGVALSFLFRAPDLGQEKLDREVLDRYQDRGPVATVLACRRHLERHPRDAAALAELADALNTLGEIEDERQALLRLLDLREGKDRLPVLIRLCKGVELNGLGSRRMVFAAELLADQPSLSAKLYASVIDDSQDPDRPEAMFALGEQLLDVDRKKAKALLAEIVDSYPDSPAALKVRARGYAQ